MKVDQKPAQTEKSIQKIQNNNQVVDEAVKHLRAWPLEKGGGTKTVTL